MNKQSVLKTICDCFDYNYKIYEDGKVVIDDGLGIDHKATLEVLNKNYCGHLEYESIDEMLVDWLDELENGEDAQKIFSEEIKFIEENKINMNKKFKDSMEVGYYFNKYLSNDETTKEWNASEECSTFTKIVLDHEKEIKLGIFYAFHDVMHEMIYKIEKEIVPTEEHMWDDYCKGFLAGEILGMPTKENLSKVRKAERLWEDNEYGYYQEVLEEVK